MCPGDEHLDVEGSQILRDSGSFLKYMLERMEAEEKQVRRRYAALNSEKKGKQPTSSSDDEGNICNKYFKIIFTRYR